jgi:uncharacterized iron-regulated membrane protein
MFRKSIFWLHLFCGVIAGIVVLIMSITGVALTYQKQMTAWADQRLYKIPAPANAAPLSTELLLQNFQKARPASYPMSITLSSNPEIAASIATGPNEIIFVNPYTGEILGTGSQSVRTFFKVTTDWHRWLALTGENRGIGKAVTGVCNLAFLLLVITGLYLWWPQKWTLGIFRTLAWFRLGVSGKARDSNWHYVFGFWCLIPLFFIVISGVVISYAWASSLVFQLTGSKVVFKGGPPGGKKPGPMGMNRERSPLQVEGLDALMSSVRNYTANWKTITFQLPGVVDKTASFTVDIGSGVRPQDKFTLILDKSSAQVVRAEKFENMDRGLRARIWLRFVHTGEFYGFLGQTIAGIASLAGVLLVWTGIALTFRRYIAWTRRRAGI